MSFPRKSTVIVLITMTVFMLNACVPAPSPTPSPSLAEQAAQPTAHPVGGPTLEEPWSVPIGTRVTMSTATSDAAIYYTLDGTNPDHGRSGTTYLYNQPIPIRDMKPTVIRAVAFHEGMAVSPTLTVVYRGLWFPPSTPAPFTPAPTPPFDSSPPPDEESGVYNQTRGISYATIQAAIDGAKRGDVIVVSPGRYWEDIEFKETHQKITVQSGHARNPAVTVIQGSGNGVVVKFNGNDSTLQGFTISGGESDFEGGGVFVVNGAPTIGRNTITNNTADSSGGGMYLEESNPYLFNNTITGNTARANNKNRISGGGLYVCPLSTPIIAADNIITDKVVDDILRA